VTATALGLVLGGKGTTNFLLADKNIGAREVFHLTDVPGAPVAEFLLPFAERPSAREGQERMSSRKERSFCLFIPEKKVWGKGKDLP